MSTDTKRRCSVCNFPLANYNRGNQCYRHGEPEHKRKHVKPPGPSSDSINTVLDAVSREFGVSVDDLKGGARNPEAVWARHIAMHLLKNKLNMSAQKVALMFGKSNYQAVTYALRKVTKGIEEDPEIAQTVQKLEDAILH
jgi:chromosomal replication initiator protein